MPQRLYNLTPHAVHIVVSETRTVVIPSAGELRLLNVPGPVADAPLVIAPDDGLPLPLVGASRFTGLDPDSPGYKVLMARSAGDQIIVSMATAQWLRDNHLMPPHGIVVLAPATGPGMAVRDDQKQVRGARALEFYGLC
jgi:hypothetical protein